MKEIPLTQGQIALVDDDKFEYLNQWKWHAYKAWNTYYACRRVPRTDGKGRQRGIKMHHEVFGKITQIDHIDGNGCNNQLKNLRMASSLENSRNRKKNKNCSSIYKGVYWNKRHLKWYAFIRVGELLSSGRHKQIYLGKFDIEIDAAKAYDARAKVEFGEFAKLNFPSID